jgi:hypothetical protein
MGIQAWQRQFQKGRPGWTPGDQTKSVKARADPPGLFFDRPEGAIGTSGRGARRSYAGSSRCQA